MSDSTQIQPQGETLAERRFRAEAVQRLGRALVDIADDEAMSALPCDLSPLLRCMGVALDALSQDVPALSAADANEGARDALAQARERHAELCVKGIAAQRIGRGLVAIERDDVRVTPKDISVALIRVLAIVRDMMELSGSVIAASESAITAAATADKEGDHAP
jgi:hypothetical protein